MVSRLFGKKQPQKSKEQLSLEAISGLRTTIEDLDKRQNVIQLKATQALEEAKAANAKKNKQQALFHLKKKKMYEAEVAKIDGEKMTLETQLFAIENAHTHANVFNTVKGANSVIKQINENISVEEIDKLQAEMEEQQALQEEIGEALSQPIGFMNNLNEEDLLAELDEMEALEFEQSALKQLEGTSVPNTLPQIPNQQVQPVKQQEKQVVALNQNDQQMDDLLKDFQ